MYRKFSTVYLLFSLFMIIIEELHNITNNYVLLWDGEREQHLLTVMLNSILDVNYVFLLDCYVYNGKDLWL